MKHRIHSLKRMPNGLRDSLNAIRMRNHIGSDPNCPLIECLVRKGKAGQTDLNNAVKETNVELKKWGVACIACPTWLELKDSNDFGGDAVVRHYTDYRFLDGSCFVKIVPDWKTKVILDWIDQFGLRRIEHRNIPESIKSDIHVFRTKFIDDCGTHTATVKVVGTSMKAIEDVIWNLAVSRFKIVSAVEITKKIKRLKSA